MWLAGGLQLEVLLSSVFGCWELTSPVVANWPTPGGVGQDHVHQPFV